MGCGERGFEVRDQTLKWPGQSPPPRDQNIGAARQPIKGKHRLRHGAKTPARPISFDGATNLAARRKSHPHYSARLLRHGSHFQGQSVGNAANTLGGAKKIGALFQAPERRLSLDWRCGRRCGLAVGCGQAESFLRPWARRRASTLRPPTVAIRARKPWRRFRTILLG